MQIRHSKFVLRDSGEISWLMLAGLLVASCARRPDAPAMAERLAARGLSVVIMERDR